MSPLPGSPENGQSSANAAAAALARANQAPKQKPTTQLVAEHDRRQAFRRLIDPGILRPNSKEQASSSLKTLLTIAENLLRDPENPKFKQFKSTNVVIQRELIKPKGAIEYAIEMGFRPEVENFQPFYRFIPRYMDDLRIGAKILRDHLELEMEKVERAARAKANEKIDAAAAAERVKLAFMDDRRQKETRDEMEKQRRMSYAADPPISISPGTSPSSPSTFSESIPINENGSQPKSQSDNPPL